MGLAEIFTATSLALGLPQGLLSSVCWVESNHNVRAIHHNDGQGTSLGICQIKRSTAAFLAYRGTESGLREPETNIWYSGLYLAKQHRRYGSWTKAICAYNRGSCYSNGINRYTSRVFVRWGEEEVLSERERRATQDVQAEDRRKKDAKSQKLSLHQRSLSSRVQAVPGADCSRSPNRAE